MLSKWRRLAAALCGLLVTGLFLDFTGTLHLWLGWLAKIQFLPAVLALNVGVVVVLIALTLLLGRIYCSVICPLGVFQDVVARLGLRQKKYRYAYSPAKSWLRYAVLALFVVALVAGVSSVVVLLAPYSAYGRMVSALAAPVYVWGNNLLAYWAEQAESYQFYETEVWLKSLPALLMSVVFLLIIVVLAWRNGRTYCNTICPVGTVLSFFARFSWFRPEIDTTKCNSCGLCARRCKAACIDSVSHQIDYSRCVVCLDCLDTCKKGALHYVKRGTYTAAKSDNTENVDRGRRSFLSASALAVASSTLYAQEKKVDGGLAAIADKKVPERQTPLVPPGAQGIRHFSQHCTACQLCVSVCPNQVLRPSSDLSRWMQPEMSYERGYCRPECTKCSEVCPAGAIRLIDKAEKSSVQIGHAVWIKKNCVVLTDNVDCGNCARHCPTGAISMVASDPQQPDSRKIPVVDTEKCIGCGACENLCPARPFSAIYVEGHERHKMI